MSFDSIIYKPIGLIRSEHKRPEETPIQPAYAIGDHGRVEVLPGYAEGLRDLDGFSHVYLVYHFHVAGPAKLVVEPFLQDVERGTWRGLIVSRGPATAGMTASTRKPPS